MEEVTEKEKENKAAERMVDPTLGMLPASVSQPGEARATVSQTGALQELKGWGPGEAEARACWLQQDDALSIPGSAEEDEETEAIQAMVLGQELQCRLQLHLEQLEAKAKARAKTKARARAKARAAAAARKAAAGCPRPAGFHGGQGEPHMRAGLTQVPKEGQLGEKRSSESFGEPFWNVGWGPKDKGKPAAEAWGELQAASPARPYQRMQLHPELGLKDRVPEGSNPLGLTHENYSFRDPRSQKPGQALPQLGQQLERTSAERTVAYKERSSEGN